MYHLMSNYLDISDFPADKYIDTTFSQKLKRIQFK